MIQRVSWQNRDSLDIVLAALRDDGCAIVHDVLDDATLVAAREGIYRGKDLVESLIGRERLQQAGEIGVVRAPMLASPVFYDLLALPPVLAIVDATVSTTAVLHVQNAFALPPAAPQHQDTFQRTFHRDFPRVLNGYVCSVNMLLAIDDFTFDNGATLVIPGSHQRADAPPTASFESAAPAECPRGGMIVFDSTLWHAAGINQSAVDRCAVNQQFTRSYFKQQIDYVRCLGDEVVAAQSPRVQQLLGWYTRVPTSLTEYYLPERLYRQGQG
ncbi:MAG TPA: phytanoyl-CoA dioxygenase family protein [Thermoanaerobaculia bacterium]|nr:phytanoyl-CoA dioxygenase family protein [Thermoanaerobaculia bacterium]